jgi:hypothetical protein
MEWAEGGSLGTGCVFVISLIICAEVVDLFLWEGAVEVGFLRPRFRLLPLHLPKTIQMFFECVPPLPTYIMYAHALDPITGT